MKKIVLALSVLALSSLTMHAQFHYKDASNPEMLRHINRSEPLRKEIVLPQVNGYNVYTADLHTHTIFSDGAVLPEYRIKEAWLDGLDIMAVTDHIEYRPHEETMAEHMMEYMPEAVVRNHRIANDPIVAGRIMVDLNHSYERTVEKGAEYGITIIKGSEITRDGTTVGHFNALFTTDNNKIYDPDPLQAIRNAKAQGALIMHNHPGWRKTSLNFTDVEKAAYAEGLIDGVEVMNGDEFYPGIVDRAREYALFISANTDIHSSTAFDYTMTGNLRPMTLILSKDNSLEAVREALESGRTIAWGFGTLCGPESLLKDFFTSSVKVRLVTEKDSKGRAVLCLKNLTSVGFYMTMEGENIQYLAPFSSLIVKGKADNRKMTVEVVNMFCSESAHPQVFLGF